MQAIEICCIEPHWRYIVLVKNYRLWLQLLFRFVELPLLDVQLK